MKNIFKKDYLIWLAVKIGFIAVFLVADLVTKNIFANLAESGRSTFTLIDGVISFIYVENTGAAFSIFSNGTMFLAILSVIFVVGFFTYDYFSYTKSLWYVSSFVLIVAGAVGNMVDRLWLGYVRDFIRFDFVTFPIFNIADICLTVGLIIYGIYILFFYDKQKKAIKG